MYRNSSFVLRDIYGKHILMPVKTNKACEDPILLNDVARDIWESASNELCINDFSARICEMYSLQANSPEAMAITGFISQLVEMGLITEMREG